MKSRINWLDHGINLLAVIFGVTLAFLINSYSENQRDIRDKNEILANLKRELEEDLSVYRNNTIPYNENQSAQIQKLISLLRATPSTSATDSIIKPAFSLKNYLASTVSFNQLQSSGRINNIKNDQLKSSLLNYFEVTIHETENRNQAQYDFLSEQLLNWAIDNMDVSQPKMNSLRSIQFINRLVFYKSIIDNKLEIYYQVVEEGEEIVLQIEQEIK